MDRLVLEPIADTINASRTTRSPWQSAVSYGQDGCAIFFGHRADFEFRRSYKRFRLAAATRLQSRANSLWTHESNDHARPNQRAAGECAG